MIQTNDEMRYDDELHPERPPRCGCLGCPNCDYGRIRREGGRCIEACEQRPDGGDYEKCNPCRIWTGEDQG